jgi:hypothetical protein
MGQLVSVILWVRPDGWQSKARRNAWSSMVDDSQRRHDRDAADRAAAEHDPLRRADASALRA